MVTEPGRYSRQILFAPIGPEGQRKLSQARVVIVGCGALGAAQAAALARAGVGQLRIVDRDFVEDSNLQRQSLFDEADAAERLPKAIAARRKLAAINSEVEVDPQVTDLDSRNAEALIGGCQVILDGVDNFETRYLMNDAAVKLGIPWIYGAVVAAYAVTMTVRPGRTACLACVLPKLPRGMHETCDTAGVIGPAAAWAAAIQTAEALKILTGHEDALHGQLLACDLWANRLQQVEPHRNPDCAVCARREFLHLEGLGASHVTLCGRNSVQIHQHEARRLDLSALEARLAHFGPVLSNAFLLQARLESYELTVFPDGRAIIKGTGDAAVARSLYARYIGA